MTDPMPVPERVQPRRAEPLQPDLPGRGQGVEPAPDATPPPDKAAQQQKEQAQTALDNVREGYD